jgi:hypothetical protein
MTTTIGFFGDSFCNSLANSHSREQGYRTYIDLVSEHYQAEIVNLGHTGTSVWDTYLRQLLPLIKQGRVPDICVFVWTNHSRMYHAKLRNINNSTALHGQHTEDQAIWSAARAYYQHLDDEAKSHLEYCSFLYYLDYHLFKQLPKTTKLIHLWSFGRNRYNRSGDFHPDSLTYDHQWSQGATIEPALISTALIGHRGTIHELLDGPVANHIEGDKNLMVFEWICRAIDQYSHDQPQIHSYQGPVAGLGSRTS